VFLTVFNEGYHGFSKLSISHLWMEKEKDNQREKERKKKRKKKKEKKKFVPIWLFPQNCISNTRKNEGRLKNSH